LPRRSTPPLDAAGALTSFSICLALDPSLIRPLGKGDGVPVAAGRCLLSEITKVGLGLIVRIKEQPQVVKGQFEYSSIDGRTQGSHNTRKSGTALIALLSN
jgi:hypothetical protein